MLFAPGAASGNDSLRVSAELVDGKYCLAPSGAVTLSLHVGVTYENSSLGVIILPRFTRVVGYRLFLGEDQSKASQAESRVAYRLEPMLDASKLDRSAPQPELFDVLKPGSQVRRIHPVEIVVSSPGGSTPSILGKDYYLQVDVDNWAAARGPGLKLLRAWKPLGLLWMDATTLPRVKLHIEDHPRAKRCEVRID